MTASGTIDPTLELPSNAYGSMRLLLDLVPLLAIYAAAPVLADVSHGLAWATMPAIGLLLYRLTMIMHDCGHATLFTSRRANRIVGKLIGYVSGIDFDRFRERHWEHHRGYGLAGDPQGFHYFGIAQMSRASFVWHLLRPLLGFNLRYAFPESHLHPANLRAALGSGEIGALLATQIMLVALLTGLGRHPSLLLLPLVGAATVGLFLSQLRGIAEHGLRPAGTAERAVRSHARDWLGALLLYDVHFNFHAEHHRHPGIPSCRLPALAARERAADSAPAARSIWRTLASMAAAS